jgi:peptide deformylase
MPIHEIVTSPAPVLRTRAHKVREVTPEIRQLLDDMVDTMRAAPGVGLAAPQVGVSQRLIVVEYADEDESPDGAAKPPKLFAMVNPEIARCSAETVAGTEGCLSIPGYLGVVDRATSVTVKGLNRIGQPVRVKATGWLARIFQHEIDHLDGVLFIDRASEVWRAEPEEAVTVPV